MAILRHIRVRQTIGHAANDRKAQPAFPLADRAFSCARSYRIKPNTRLGTIRASNRDDDVAAMYLQLQNDSFAYGAYSMARTMTDSSQKAYLYYFTYAEKGKRAHLGAYHGEELKFLSDSFPDDWEHNPEDEELGKTMRIYWMQFAKTGNPNSPDLAV
jgi:carboxylesterase type B